MKKIINFSIISMILVSTIACTSSKKLVVYGEDGSVVTQTTRQQPSAPAAPVFVQQPPAVMVPHVKAINAFNPRGTAQLLNPPIQNVGWTIKQIERFVVNAAGMYERRFETVYYGSGTEVAMHILVPTNNGYEDVVATFAFNAVHGLSDVINRTYIQGTNQLTRSYPCPVQVQYTSYGTYEITSF